MGMRPTICEMRLCGSCRSPATMAWVGQTVTHGGSSPTSTLCGQKLHFAAVSVCGSM